LFFQTGGPSYAVELGRLDGRVSTKASVTNHLPHPEFKLAKLTKMFASHGLTLTDLIALSGSLYIIMSTKFVSSSIRLDILGSFVTY